MTLQKHSIEVKLSDDKNAHIFKNLWPLYQHEFSEFDTSLVTNCHGLFGVDDSVKTLTEHSDLLSPYWRKTDSIFPYLIFVDGHPAGFNLVAARSILQDEIDADFVVHEFFVLHAYRGKGVAERGAIEGFNRHRGKWEIVTTPTNTRAIAFWRRVVRNYVPNRYSEKEMDHPWGRRVAFTFDNTVKL